MKAIRWALLLACFAVPACSGEVADGGRPSEAPQSDDSSDTSKADRSAQVPEIVLQTKVEGLSSPLGLTSARDGTGRLFVMEQAGLIRIVKGNRLFGRPYLDISSKITSGGEQGLLGLAFHPRFEDNRRFYVNYTDTNGDTVIAEYRQSRRTRDRAVAGSERIVLTFDQPFANHNGGHLAFGPDGYLYIASGDGGSAGDPQNNGQRRDTLLGKILRIDIDKGRAGRGYGIPPDNPFRDDPTARPEIWSYGLRNPWRFSFDRRTDVMWIGDVGQGEWEEIDREAATSDGGINWGWKIKEGSHCYVTPTECEAAGATEDLVDPIAEYSHDFGCSVTGGYVYRGQRYPGFRGLYFFADYCSGNIWTIDASDPGAQEEVLRLESGRSIASFGETAAGELYVVDHSGTLLRIVAEG